MIERLVRIRLGGRWVGNLAAIKQARSVVLRYQAHRCEEKHRTQKDLAGRDCFQEMVAESFRERAVQLREAAAREWRSSLAPRFGQ